MVKIGEWGIDSDENSYIVKKKYFNKKKQTEEYVNVCYPVTLKSCFEWIMRNEEMNLIRDKDMTLIEAILHLNRLHDKYEKMLDDVMKGEVL